MVLHRNRARLGAVADAMMQFAEEHNISVRGHNILWDDPEYQPSWVQSLWPAQLRKATYEWLLSVTTKYKGHGMLSMKIFSIHFLRVSLKQILQRKFIRWFKKLIQERCCSLMNMVMI
ncbi:hypothetical protein L6164_032113 [Bauhinia variegata]|uniref:Uncharacterized protein n=1 Tax=Bauhinia variegata TaxID=167791 RepID=A0ACB9KMJ7_BAUVA|nr:hypothetical protein L6164_032113 [Bauhinia variegata]